MEMEIQGACHQRAMDVLLSITEEDRCIESKVAWREDGDTQEQDV